MKRYRHPLWTALVLAVLVVPCTQEAWGQAIQWRDNYATARKEAQEKGLPLLLDFGTKECYYCKLMDAQTFPQPPISKLVNEQFVPLRIDANVEADLTQKLRVSSYPTFILADCDGKILGTIEGYQDAPRFQESLLRALSQVANPPWMLQDFQTANKALAVPDYAKAVTLLKTIIEDGKDRPIQKKARQLLDGIEDQAATRLAKVRQSMDKGQTANAAEELANLVQKYPGTLAAKEAGTFLSNTLVKTPDGMDNARGQQARFLLGEAKQMYESEEYLLCLQCCKKLMEKYGDLPESKTAFDLNKAIRDNPVWMEKTCTDLNQQLGEMYLSQANSWHERGQRDKALNYLQKVIAICPNTTVAEAANLRINQLNGQPTLAVEFKASP